MLLAGKIFAGEQEHILRAPFVGDKGYYAPEFRVKKLKARFLQRLAAHALVGTFPWLELAAYTYPLVLVAVIFLAHTVEHKVLVAPLDVAEGGHLHLPHLKDEFTTFTRG